MKRDARVGSLQIQGWNPIVAGVVVGLLTGLIGLFATSILANGNPIGGLAGAVGCGITVAYLTHENLFNTILYAFIADVLSSIVFFCLVLVAYLTMVAVTEGLVGTMLASVWFTVYYVVFGGIFAIFIGGISVAITALTATITTVVTRHKTDTAVGRQG